MPATGTGHREHRGPPASTAPQDQDRAGQSSEGWDPHNLETVKAWNNQGRTRAWRLDRLPRDTEDSIPFFEGCPYHYDESTTKILSTQDLMMIMGFSFCRVHL